MWAELSVSHFLKSNYWKRSLQIIFKGNGCFQFLEAVVTSTAKGSIRSVKRGSLQVVALTCKLNFSVLYHILSYKSVAGLSRFV